MAAIEVKATHAYYKTYIEELNATHKKEITSIEAEIEDLKAAHANEIASLKAQTATADDAIRHRERTAFQAGEAKALTVADGQISQLKDALKEKGDEIKNLQTAHNNAIHLRDGNIRTFKALANTTSEELRTIRAVKDHEIANWKRNSAYEVKFRTKGGRVRTYLLRPGARFVDGVEEICRGTGNPIQWWRFYTSKKPMDSLTREEWKTKEAVREIIPGNKTVDEVRVVFR